MLLAVVFALLVAFNLEIESSDAFEQELQREYQQFLLPKIPRLQSSIKEDCTVDESKNFIGCMKRFVGAFGLEMTNGKLPDASDLTQIILNENKSVACDAYKNLKKCPVFAKCFEKSVFESITEDDDTHSKDPYSRPVATAALSCWNAPFTCCLDITAHAAEGCLPVEFPDNAECSLYMSIQKCYFGKQPCGKKFAEAVCTALPLGPRYYQVIDAKCYDQMMDVCSKAPIVINLEIAISLILFMTIAIVN